MGKLKSRNELLEVDRIREIAEGSGSKSNKFVELYNEGLSISEISRVMESVYSFVYGVIDKKVGIERGRRKEGVKSNLFRNEWDKGLSIGEISKKYNSNYSYVWSVVDRYRKENEE